jgi:hypothetical protein
MKENAKKHLHAKIGPILTEIQNLKNKAAILNNQCPGVSKKHLLVEIG